MKFLNLLLIIYKIFSKLGNYFHNFFFIMSVFLSKSCEYGLQAILYLSHKSSAEPLTLHDIADNLDVPRHFLSKILQSLARDGIVVSHRGIKGGFRLAKPAAAPIAHARFTNRGNPPRNYFWMSFREKQSKN